MSDLAAVPILIPGAAGSAAIGALRTLRQKRYAGRLIATDGEKFAAGFSFSDAHYLTYGISDPQAYRRMMRVIDHEKVGIILPTSATDSAVYSKNKSELWEAGARFAGCDGPVVALCDDKLQFSRAVQSRFAVPATIEIGDGGPVCYPCFVKPRFGSGSRGAGLCEDESDWQHYTKHSTGLIAQEPLVGAEYSVDVLSDLRGNPLIAVVRERLTITDGVSTRILVKRDEEIESMCLGIARYLNLKGLCCIQLKRDVDGRLKFLEVNARIGGSAAVSALAGIDLVMGLVDLALGRSFIPGDFAQTIVVRYLDETVLKA